MGERNALYFEFYENDEPLVGVESGLDLTVNYAGETFRGNLNPKPEAGAYSMDILPTIRGQYQVLLSGAIGDTPINELLEPEEVLPASVLQFPEAPLDAAAMQANMDDLAGQLQTMQLLALGAIVLAVIAIAVALFSLVRSRR